MGGQFRVLPGSPAAGLLTDQVIRCSILAENQARLRMEIDMTERYPFHLDVVEATIRLYTPAAPELTILFYIVSASLGSLSSVVHHLVRFLFLLLYPCSYDGLFSTGPPLDQGLVSA
jgi:hypothetical protein